MCWNKSLLSQEYCKKLWEKIKNKFIQHLVLVSLFVTTAIQDVSSIGWVSRWCVGEFFLFSSIAVLRVLLLGRKISRSNIHTARCKPFSLFSYLINKRNVLSWLTDCPMNAVPEPLEIRSFSFNAISTTYKGFPSIP